MNYNLVFYYFESCPFCQMVLTTIREHNFDIEFKDILRDEAALNKLIADTGRRTVPCLYIDGKPMHESRDIIDWLEANKDNIKKKNGS